jgi:hypothetical protein
VDNYEEAQNEEHVLAANNALGGGQEGFQLPADEELAKVDKESYDYYEEGADRKKNGLSPTSIETPLLKPQQ